MFHSVSSPVSCCFKVFHCLVYGCFEVFQGVSLHCLWLFHGVSRCFTALFMAVSRCFKVLRCTFSFCFKMFHYSVSCSINLFHCCFMLFQDFSTCFIALFHPVSWPRNRCSGNEPLGLSNGARRAEADRSGAAMPRREPRSSKHTSAATCSGCDYHHCWVVDSAHHCAASHRHHAVERRPSYAAARAEPRSATPRHVSSLPLRRPAPRKQPNAAQSRAV